MADDKAPEQTGGRPPTGARPLRGRPRAKVDLNMLQASFDRPQPEAAQSLGISLTCLKMMCRRRESRPPAPAPAHPPASPQPALC